MVNEPMSDIIVAILKVYGPAGISVLTLIAGMAYVAWRSAKERDTCREDFLTLHEDHRSSLREMFKQHQADRNDWHKANINQQKVVMDVISGNSIALKDTAVALEKLSIHIENCSRR